MIESTEIVNKNEFLKSLKKKLENVIKKAPILARIKIAEPNVYIDISTLPENLIYTIDYSIKIEDNIFNIRKMLIDKSYPVFPVIDSIKRRVTADEAEKLINDGMNVDTALAYTITENKKTLYRIERVIIPRDEMFVRNLETMEEGRYKLGMPITSFLKRYRELWTPEETGKVFRSKAIFKEKVYSESEWVKIKKGKEKVEIIGIS